MKLSRSMIAKVGVAMLALAAATAASVAQARDNVYFSIGAHVAPGVHIGASNVPQYYYYAPAPVYVQPAPVYYTTPHVYVRPGPVFVRPVAPVYAYGPGYYDDGHRHRHGGHRRHAQRHGHRHHGRH